MGRWIRSMYMDLVDRREVDDNLYRVTIAANEKVRRPPDLEFAGLSTENYFKNPVVMWAHDSEGRSPSGGLPVARTVALSKGVDGRLVADFEFLTDDPFAQRIKNAWDKGFLKAASISWLPVETAPDEGGQWRDTRSELLEWSIVPVPADPDALRRAKLRMTAESDPRAEEGAYGREGLSLSPHDLDDLREALFLMRGVLDEMGGPRRRRSPGSACRIRPKGWTDGGDDGGGAPGDPGGRRIDLECGLERRGREGGELGMSNTDTKAIKKGLAEINSFVRERLDPVSQDLALVQEETERLKKEVADLRRRERASRRDALAAHAGDAPSPAVPEGPYAGVSVLDLGLLRRFAHSQRRESFGPAWVERVEEARRMMVAGLSPAVIQGSYDAASRRLGEWYTVDRRRTGQFESFSEAVLQSLTRAAMDSTTAGSGDELVATLEARELWMDVNLQTLVAPLIPMFPMPSNPFDIPHQLGDVSFYPGTENVPSPSTAPSTGKSTLTAFELVGQVPYSLTLEEDAVVAMLPEIRAGLVRNVAEAWDDIILNADTTKTNNINADGATISSSDAGKGHWLIGYDGIIHLPLVDNTSQSNDHAAGVSDDMFNEIRAKLGKYGVRPSQLAWIMDVNTFIRAQSVSQFRTMDKLGPNATLLTGMLGAIEGIPVIVSEHMALADTDGKVTDAGNGANTGRLLIVNRSQWAQGVRRKVAIEVDRDVQKRQTVVVVSFRHALTERSGARSTATHTALQYDITGVA